MESDGGVAEAKLSAGVARIIFVFVLCRSMTAEYLYVFYGI